MSDLPKILRQEAERIDVYLREVGTESMSEMNNLSDIRTALRNAAHYLERNGAVQGMPKSPILPLQPPHGDLGGSESTIGAQNGGLE